MSSGVALQQYEGRNLFTAELHKYTDILLSPSSGLFLREGLENMKEMISEKVVLKEGWCVIMGCTVAV